MKPVNATGRTPTRRRRRSLGGRWLTAGAVTVAISVMAGCSLRLLTGQGHPPIVTTPDDYSATNDAPAFQTMLSFGDGTLLADGGKAYWCTTTSCAGGPSLAAWTGSLFYSVAGRVLQDGRPVLAGLTQVHGDTLRLSLLGCSRRTCTATGGGAFTAPGFNPATLLNTVYAASTNGGGLAVAFGNGAGSRQALYVAVCDSVRCQHPSATRLRGVFNGFTLGPGVSNIAVAAAPDGGFAAAMPDPQQDSIAVYECPEAPCRAVARQQIAVPAGGATAIIAITVTSSGQTLLAYDSGYDIGGLPGGSQVVLATAAPGGSFSRLAAVNAPVTPVNPDNFPDAKPAPAPAIVFAGRDLMVVSEDASGHAVTLTTCVATSCGNTTEVRQAASPGNPEAQSLPERLKHNGFLAPPSASGSSAWHMCPASDGPVPAEPTAANIEREHPQWRTWVGVDRLCHGLRTKGAALTARSEDWQGLLDEIRRAEAMLKDMRPRGWP